MTCPNTFLNDLLKHFGKDFGDIINDPATSSGAAGSFAAAAVNFAVSKNKLLEATTQVLATAAADFLPKVFAAGLQQGEDPGPARVGAVSSGAIGLIEDVALGALLPESLPLVAAAGIAVASVAVATALGTAAQAFIESAQDVSNGATLPPQLPTDGLPDSSPTTNDQAPVGGDPDCPGVDRSKRTPSNGVPGNAPTFNDPLVLDLAGAGISLTNIADSSAYFDYGGNGIRQHTGWVGSGMGLLVRDPGPVQPFTAQDLLGAENGSGFGDLQSFDTNGDGIVDGSDAGFTSLRVWVDTNGDGTVAPGELFTLEELGISAINVTPTQSTDSVSGNQVTATSTFTMNGNETAHSISEVSFQTDSQATIIPSATNVQFTWDALRLPNLDGYGSMPDLRATMSMDNSLANEVKSLVLGAASMSGDQFDAAFQQMVLDWAGVAGVDPSSDGSYVDARHVALIYAFYGIDPATNPYYQNQPNWHNGPGVWEPTYRTIIDELKTRLAAQIGQSLANYGANTSYLLSNPYTIFAGLEYDETTDSFVGDLQTVFEMVAFQAPTDIPQASQYWAQILPIIEGLRVDEATDSTAGRAKILSLAAAAGLPSEIVDQIAADFGLSIADESNQTGFIVVDGSHSIVLIGTGKKNISGGDTSTFIYGADSGNVTLNATEAEAVLVFTGLIRAAVYFERSPGSADLKIVNSTSGSTLTWLGYFNVANGGSIQFADSKFYTNVSI